MVFMPAGPDGIGIGTYVDVVDDGGVPPPAARVALGAGGGAPPRAAGVELGAAVGPTTGIDVGAVVVWADAAAAEMRTAALASAAAGRGCMQTSCYLRRFALASS